MIAFPLIRRRILTGRLLAFLIMCQVDALAADCGVAPVPPVPEAPCLWLDPQCQCDADGHCFWVFICRTTPEEASA